MSGNLPAVVPLGIGIHEGVPEARYHSDPCDGPSASASILKLLYDRSPLHAWWSHPKLRPDYTASDATDAMNDGSILHSLILGTPPPYIVTKYEKFQSDEAKAAKAAAAAGGKIAITQSKFAKLKLVAHALRNRIADIPELNEAVESAQKEVTLIWEEPEALCRCRFDILPSLKFDFALDLKFTGQSAEPGQWDRTLVNNHLFQAALYPRAVKRLRGDNIEMRFLVAETDPPYGISLHAMDSEMAEIADQKVNRALSIWQRCLELGEWPGYPSHVHYQATPAWEISRYREREIRLASTGDQYQRLYSAAGGPPR